MYKKYYQRLNLLSQNEPQHLFKNNLIGLEKESLRVNREGRISQTAHPVALGAALTNPYITTDYSEALLELITPPHNSIPQALNFLKNAQKYVYQNLDNEILWATSMPCIIAGETSIPIAQYGKSNAGKMKSVYRNGLGLRYGREMQVIAGVHFNFSLSDEFWDFYKGIEKTELHRQDFISDSYFGLIRNLQRFGWLVPYLFGASPTVCKSFLGNKTSTLDEFDKGTLYQPYATSLRMGDIGYQNNKENEIGIKACYKDVEAYVQSLTFAIQTSVKEYEQMGVKKDGEYIQLNTNILQIENEYYSTIRPKQLLNNNEKPTLALQKRGVKYVELRSLDVNAYDPLGVNDSQLYFLEAFLIFCLLHESEIFRLDKRYELDHNEMLVAHRGRLPGLKLRFNDEDVFLKDWANEICDNMYALCEILDLKEEGEPYTNSLKRQIGKINDPSQTPSARMLDEMRENEDSFHRFASRMSKLHQHYFKNISLSDTENHFFTKLAKDSLDKQIEIEESDKLSFDTYLDNYFNQT